MKLTLILIYILCSTGGMTLMKMGGDTLKLSFRGGIYFSMGTLTFFGFVLYLISFLMWQKMLVKYELSTLVPMVSGSVQVVILMLGHFVFRETLKPMGLAGALLVVTGIILMGFAGR